MTSIIKIKKQLNQNKKIRNRFSCKSFLIKKQPSDFERMKMSTLFTEGILLNYFFKS